MVCDVVVPAVIAKPVVTATEDTVPVEPPLLVTVTATALESVLTRTPPNAIEAGDAVMSIGGAVPVPDSVSVCVCEVDVIVSTQLTVAATVGWNVALNEYTESCVQTIWSPPSQIGILMLP